MRPSKAIVAPAIAIAAVALAAALVIPARATFPGENGRIAFRVATDVNNVYTINPDGSDERQLTSLGPNNSAFNASWSPDGRALVFAVGSTSGDPSGQIWMMNADGSNQREIFADPGVTDFDATFSPDGQFVAFARCAVGCAIYRIRSDGSGLTAITNFDPNPDVIEEFPAYSPDGAHIAFGTLSLGGVLDAVYLADADGSQIQQLTPPGIGGSLPDWSPNGEQIAFHTNDPGCDGCFFPNSEIWEIGANGEGLRRLTRDPNFFDLNPSWAPQGNAIVFEQDDPTFTTSQLFILTLNGGGAEAKMIRSVRRNPRPAAAARTKANRSAQRRKTLLAANGFTPRWGVAPQ